MIAFEAFVNSLSKSTSACVALDNYVNEIDVNKLARCFYSAQRSADRNTETGSSAVSVSQVESKMYESEEFCILVYNDITGKKSVNIVYVKKYGNKRIKFVF